MASLRFKRALDCTRYADADEELKSLEKWLEEINPSAAESLREGRKELLTIHQLEVPPLLRKTLLTTNPIESMFSHTSWRTRNLRNVGKGKMAQRWLGAALIESERSFRKVKGYLAINEVRSKIVAIKKQKATSIA